MGGIQALKENLNYCLAPLLETPVPIPNNRNKGFFRYLLSAPLSERSQRKGILYHTPIRATRDGEIFVRVPSQPFGTPQKLQNSYLFLSTMLALTLAMSNLLLVCLHNKHAVVYLVCHPKKMAGDGLSEIKGLSGR